MDPGLDRNPLLDTEGMERGRGLAWGCVRGLRAPVVLGRVTAGSAQWLLWRVTTRGGAEKPRQTEGSAETCPRWVVGPSPELGRGPRGLSRAQPSRSVCVSPARALALGHPVRLLSHLSLSCAVGCLVATPEERGRGPSR